MVFKKKKEIKLTEEHRDFVNHLCTYTFEGNDFDSMWKIFRGKVIEDYAASIDDLVSRLSKKDIKKIVKELNEPLVATMEFINLPKLYLFNRKKEVTLNGQRR